MEESDMKDLEVKDSSGVINNGVPCSSTDDNAIIVADQKSPGPLNEPTSFELPRAVDADKAVDMANNSKQIEGLPQLLQTPESERSTKNVKCNLRKSLAWDSAFFTSDGVLDAEELSTMIDGGGKVAKNQLPGIDEEVYRSMDSISTLESENLTLEGLEAELFEDIRASIQKSTRASNLTNSSSKASSGKGDSHAKPSISSKKADLASAKRPAVRNRESTALIPKIISRTNPPSRITAKRASLSANHVKDDHDIAKRALGSQQGTQAANATTQALKGAGAIAPRRAVPKPSLSSKSSSLGSSTAIKTQTTGSSSLCGSSSSSSGTNVKASANFARRKVDSKPGKPTAGSNPKTPSRIGLKNKAPPVSSRLSSHLVSSNLSSNISPASSISEWSVESSSSTSSVNRKSISRGSIDTSVSQRSLDSDASADSVLNSHPTDLNSEANRNQRVALPPTQSSSLARPPPFQPTGLRMPSPKIGFFDGGKSAIRTPNRTSNIGIQSRSQLPSGLPRTGAVRCSPTGSSNSSLIGKLPPPKIVTAETSLKTKTEKMISPTQYQAQESAKAKPSRGSKGVKSSPVMSTKVLNEKDDIDASKIEISIQGSDNSKEINVAPAEDGATESESNVCINSSHQVDDNTNGQHHLLNKLPGKIDVKENSQLEMPKKLEGNDESCFELSSAPELHLNKSTADNSRTPFAVKNSVCHTNEPDILRGSGVEVLQKTANLPSSEIRHNENTEVV